MPLLPVALLVILVTLMVNPIGKKYPDSLRADGQRGIVESCNANNTGQHLLVSFNTRGYGDVKARLTVPSTYTEYHIGDSVTFFCKLKKPERRTLYENDYTAALRAQGIIYTGFVPPDSSIITGQSDNLYWRIRRLRPLAGELLKRSSLSAPACEFLTATLIGDTSTLTEDTRQLFSSAGIAHVLALSGLHVGILIIVITVILCPLYIFRLRRMRLLLTIGALWLYAVFTGLSPSVTRAVVMATAVSGGLILQRRYFGFNGLLLALCVIVIASPRQLYQPGFQMSFLSVASILAIAPLINRLNRKNRVTFYLASMAGVSVAATIGTGIVSAYYFHTFPLYFLIANIPVLMILPFLMGGGILLMLLEAAGLDPVWLCIIIDTLYHAIHAYAGLIATLPGATIDNLYFPAWLAIPYYLTVVTLIAAIYLRRRSMKIVCVTLVCITTFCFSASQPVYADEEIFLTRDTYSTTCLYRNRDKVYMLTTARPVNARDLINKYQRTYSDYLGRHGADSIRLVRNTVTIGSIVKAGCLTTIKDKRYITVTGQPLPPPDHCGHIDYAIVCRGFRGNVLDIHKEYAPDTILLGNDLHPRRHDRYADSLALYKIPFRSLKQK